MIANFFNKTKPINFLVLSTMMIFVYLLANITVFTSNFSFGFFLKKSILLLMAILLIFILNFIIRKNTLTDNNSYALLFFILLFGFFPYSFANSNLLVANFILLFSYRRIYSLRTSIHTKEKIFDGAFWIGVATLFYLWSVVFIFLLYAAIWVFNKGEKRNVFIPIFGIITPVFLTYVYYLAVDKMNIYNDLWQVNYSFSFQPYAIYKLLIPISFLIILLISSIIPTTKKSLMAKIDFKSTWTLLTFHIILALFIVLVSPIKNGSELIFLFFPLSILFANYIQNTKKYWIKEMIIYLFVIIYFSVYLL
jgi:uncharacterized protein DUF6427